MKSYNHLGSHKSSHVVCRGGYILCFVIGTLCLSSLNFFGSVYAKTPGKTYCFRQTCHRVKTLNETKALVGRDIKFNASFYDGCTRDRFNNCGLTSSGEVYRPHKADNAASSVLPDGTVALVWSPVSGEAIVLRINNAGPYWGNRKLDLSAAAARKLGVTGVEELSLRVVKAPTEEEAKFEKNRSYEPVIGPLGKFASLESAQKAMSKIRSDGLKSSRSLASVEDVIPSSTPEVQLASLDETGILGSVITSSDEDMSSRDSLLQSKDRLSMTPSRTVASSFSIVTDFLSNWTLQPLSLEAKADIIEKSPQETSGIESKTIQKTELSETVSNISTPKNTSKDNKPLDKFSKIASAQPSVTSVILTNLARKNSQVKTKNSEKDKKTSSPNVVENVSPASNNKPKGQLSSNIKIASVVLSVGEKYPSQKSRKKNS